MATVMTMGELERVQQTWSPGYRSTSIRLYDSFNFEYGALYRLQPNIRTCVDFLARNIAQLGLHVFRRVSEKDRQRLRDHGLAQRLDQPLPPEAKVTRYRLIEALVSDMGIYFNAYWLKMRQDSEVRGLLRLPPMFVTVHGGFIPQRYEMTAGGKRWTFVPEDVVHFRGYNPENAVFGLSPLETLRRVLAEEHAAGEYRENFWQNSARMEGIIKRPLQAPEWSPTARERFRNEFEELYSGADNSGKTAILEEGMDWEPQSFTAKESEYLAGRKLTREECARAYHIPLPMVGILDHATFSNIEAQHKHLYQDALGPWLSLLSEDIDLQLLPEFGDTEGVYTEFNIQEKLRGSFEEQVQGLQASVGRPWMTADEARARMNLPSMGGDAEQLVTPLNVIVGGQASPRDTAPEQSSARAYLTDKGWVIVEPNGSGQKQLNSHFAGMRERHQEKWTEVLANHYRRQEAAITSRVPKGRKVDIGGVWFDEERWNEELSDDLLKLNNLTATAWAEQMVEQGDLQIDDMDEFETNMLPWLEEHSRVQAEGINGQVRTELEGALRDPEAFDAVRGVFSTAISVWAVQQAVTGVTAASSFGSTEAASAGGLRSKTWHVNSGNPRASHAAMAGETVGIRDTFSNGMRWPGDPSGGAAEVANCMCSVEFSQ